MAKGSYALLFIGLAGLFGYFVRYGEAFGESPWFPTLAPFFGQLAGWIDPWSPTTVTLQAVWIFRLIFLIQSAVLKKLWVPADLKNKGSPTGLPSTSSNFSWTII